MSTAIGATLKDARTKQSLSLEEVHAKIKIHPRVLQLLEDEKFDKLPSPLFAKSFLKSYADFLNVDSDALVRLYEKVEQKEPEQVLFIKPAEERARKSEPLPRWAVGLLVLAGGVFAAAVIFVGVKTIWEAAPKAPAPKAKASRPAPKKEAAPAPAKTKAADKKTKDWLRSPEQGNFPAIAKKTPLELRVTAVDNVWMRVTADGKVVFQSILKRGASQTWAAADTVEIWTGNSSNMALSLNGFNLGSPGKGVVKKLQISRAGVKIPS